MPGFDRLTRRDATTFPSRRTTTREALPPSPQETVPVYFLILWRL